MQRIVVHETPSGDVVRRDAYPLVLAARCPRSKREMVELADTPGILLFVGSTDEQNAPTLSVRRVGSVDLECHSMTSRLRHMRTEIGPEDNFATLHRIIDGKDERLVTDDDSQPANVLRPHQMLAFVHRKHFE